MRSSPVQTMTTPLVSNSHLEELGHQKVSLVVHEITKSITKGFLTGLILNRVFNSNESQQRRVAHLAIGTAFAGDAFVSDFAKELSYQHEYAREVWEHEFNSMGEVDEYISYGLSRGLTADRAREIALIITSEPSVSVPYHLAFELGLLEPGSYQQKLKHSSLVVVGFVTGTLLSEGACVIFDRLQVDRPVFNVPLSVAVCLAGLIPVIGIRYKHIGNVAGSGTFKFVAGITFASIIIGAFSVGKILK